MQIIPHRPQAWILYALVAVLVLAAVLITGLRIAVEAAPALRQEVAAVMSDRLGRPVRMAELNARLVGFELVLTLREVRIGTGRTALRLDRLGVALDPWLSMLTGEPHLSRIRIDGIELTAVRDADGLELLIGDGGLRTFTLPAELRLTGATITLIDRIADSRLRFTAVEALLERVGEGYRLRAGFDPPATLADRAELVVESETAPRSLDTFTAAGFLRLKGADVAALAALWPGHAELPPVAGRADLALWFDLADWRPVAVRATVDATALALGRSPVRLRGVEAALSWRRTGDDGWALDVAGLRLHRVTGAASPLTPTGLSLRYDRAGPNGTPRWRGSAPRLPLSEAAALAAASGLLDAAVSRQLTQLTPRGAVGDLRFAFVKGSGQWRISGELDGVAVAPVGHSPGLSGVHGRFTATDGGGHAVLEARSGALRLPRLFRAPMPFDRLDAEWAWRVAGDGVIHVAVPRLHAAGTDGRLSAHGALWVPPKGAPFLAIRARLDDGNAGGASRYLPTAIMPDKLVAWLDGAIRGGRIVDADMILVGPAAAFPFRHGEGVFDVRARVRDATLAYYPGWPALQSVDGHLRFHNAGMHVEAIDGRLFGVPLQRAVAAIPDLESPRLTVEGGFAGPGEGMLHALAASPLVDGEAAALLRRLQFSGEPTLDLKVVVPFEEARLEVDGTVQLEGAELTAPERELTVGDITGTVSFDERGLRWEGVSGHFQGGQVITQARTEGRGAAARIVIDAVFPASAAVWLGDDAAAFGERLSGRTQWLMSVIAPGFQAGDGPTRLMLDSDLRGLTVRLSPPFDKPAATARAFHAEAAFDGGALERVVLRYGELAGMQVVPGGGGVDTARIGVRLGGDDSPPALPERPGIAVSGRLPQLDLALPLPATDSGAGRLPPVRSLDVSLDEVSAGGWATAGPVHVTGRSSAEGWRLVVSGPGAAGELFLPAAAPEPLRIALEHLAVRAVEDAAPTDVMPPGPLPPLSVTVNRLQVERRPWGRVTLTVSADGAGRTAKLALEGAPLKLRADGGWSEETGRAQLGFSIDSGDVGEALARFGYARVVDGGAGHAEGELAWQGTLASPSLETLDGTASFDLRGGSLPAVEPGAGKIVGLLNIATLPRRLMLDFSDVAAEGLAFDRIRADLRLENGVAHTEMFRVDSPAAQIRLEGAIDLAAKRYDLLVTATPKISSTLPLIGGVAGALVGGPAVAAGVLITQGLFDLGLDELTRYRYRVVGDWSDPRVERLPETTSTGEGGDGRDSPDRGRANGLR